MKKQLQQLVDQALRDFVKASKLAGNEIKHNLIETEYLPAPHKPPSKIPDGMMAVYVFYHGNRCLKVGKIGPKSAARYTHHHYNPSSSGSNLARSIILHPQPVGQRGIKREDVGKWIKENTDRVNILIPTSMGKLSLSFLEAFLHCRWNPEYEG